MSIKKNYFASSMFGHLYTFSPYMGCSHNCLYCDGRAEKYHMEGNFNSDIKVKDNIVDQLTETIPKLREIAPFHLASGYSDVYQAKERDLNLTGRCSEIFSENNFHVSVLTKSNLILRDLDNWIKVNNRGGFTLQVSINTLNDTIRKKMESGASTINERLEMIKIFKEAGCNVGIFMMPLLPDITDRVTNVAPLLETLLDLNVDFITPGPLTLRPGRQKDIYINEIRHSYPSLVKNYEYIFRENRDSGSPTYSYMKKFGYEIGELFKDVVTLPPHYLYRETMPIYCEVLILLEHMLQLYNWKNIDTAKLKSAYINLKTYLKTEKKNFNRKRSLPSDHIDRHLKFLLETNSFNNIIDNRKLTDFISKVVLDREIFDYKTLRFN